MRKNATNVFVGAMDADSDERVVQPGNYIYANNILNGLNSRPGAAVNIKGTTIQEYSLPSGTNICLGTCEDKVCGTLIYFVYNSSDNHRILRWYQQDGHIEEIAGGSELDFDRYARIDADVLDGKLLYWTDAKNEKNGFVSGNEPRKINMEKASNYGKKLEYELYAGFDGQGQFAEGDTFLFTVIRYSDNEELETQTVVIPDGTYLNNVEAGLEYIYNELKAGDLDDYVEIERCDCKLIITMKDAGNKLTLESTAATVAPLLVPTNHYGTLIGDIHYYHYAVKKEPPSCAPEGTYVGVGTIGYNNVRDGCFQFRARYVYDDGEVSHCSAISNIALNNAAFGEPQEALNAIKVDFTDERLNDASWLSIIRYVDIMFRNGNDGVFRLIKRIPVCDIGIGEQYLIFANDNNYSIVPSDDLSTGAPADVQVLTNYFRVPYLAEAQAFISDEQGNTLLTYSDIQEGQTCPTCVVGSVEVENYDNADFVDIIGTVEIINDEDASSTAINFPLYGSENGGLDGFVVYLAGTSYYAVSDNPPDGSGTGAFRIKNVPRGQYVLRVASYACRYGGTGVSLDSIGAQYDLLNGIEWQKTSSPLIDCAGSVAATTLAYERTLDLYGFVGDEFDLDNEAGYGTIQVQNYHRCAKTSAPSEELNMVEVYFLDAEGLYSTYAERLSRLAVENLDINFYQGDFFENLTKNIRTDCNGYAWLLSDSANGINARAVAASWGGDNTTGPQTYHVFASNGGGFKAITNEDYPPDDLNDGETGYDINKMGPNTVTGYSPAMNVYFAFNADPEWSTDNRGVISGKCVDGNGMALGGVLLWMQTNGRTTYTNVLGEYSLIVYAYDGTSNRTAFQELRATYPPDLGGDYVPTPQLDFTVFTIPDDSPLEDINFTFAFLGGIIFDDRFRKAGGNYKVGIIYEDDDGRSPCGVTPFEDVRVPFHTEDGEYVPRRLKWTIESRPPSWATRFRIVITRDSFYQSYIHLPATQVKYVTINDSATEIKEVTYGSGEATHILLGIRTQVTPDPNALPKLVMFRDNVQRGYSSKFGDRVRYLLDETQAPVFTDSIAEVAVEGEYVDGLDYYVVIPYSEIQREVKQGWLFEFFTPKAFEEEIYFETGYCYDILTGPNRHSGDVADQDLTLPTLSPAIGYVRGGDAYWRQTQFQLLNGTGINIVTENETKNRYTEGRCVDIGRPFALDLGTDEQVFFNRVRFSGLYVPSSRINNLSAYGALDYISLNRTFGPIKWTGMAGTTLLAICQNKVQPMYVGKGRVVDMSDNLIVGRSSSIITIANETISDAGTLNPESVAVHDGRVYWWDLQRGAPFRYGPDGVTMLSKGKIGFFRQKHDERINLDRNVDIVTGGYDRLHDLYWLSFGAEYYLGPEDILIPVPSDTLMFDPAKFSAIGYGWTSHSDMHTQAYGSVNNVFLVTNNGNLYKMFDSDTYNEFFDIQNVSKIQYAINQDPQGIKDFLCMRLQANRRWYAPNVSLPANASIPSGMESQVPANRMVLREGTWWADFLRDQTDPREPFASISDADEREATALLRGRSLKGDVMVVTLETEDGSLEHIIMRADTEYTESQNTK